MDELIQRVTRSETQIEHLVEGQDKIAETITALDQKLDVVIEALAVSRGERQGIKLAVAGWSVISSGVMTLLSLILTGKLSLGD